MIFIFLLAEGITADPLALVSFARKVASGLLIREARRPRLPTKKTFRGDRTSAKYALRTNLKLKISF
jgi:hypothetical protein